MKAHELKKAYKNREIKSADFVSGLFEKIEAEKNLNGYVLLMKEKALKEAEKFDEENESGKKTGLLGGIPVSVKDNICTKGIRTSCGSKMLGSFEPVYDAHVVERLKQEGAIIIGKTNMDEFAMGSSTETSFYGPTENPHNSEYVPGGSSGGSAAVTGAGISVLSLGSDTGGSIRQPAACCGVVGVKPTYGRVSRYGLVAFASSLDQIGPLSGDVTDSALLLQAISGHDPRDNTSYSGTVPDFFPAERELSLKGKVLGIPSEYINEGLAPEIKNRIEEISSELKKAGAEVIKIDLPSTEYAIAAYYIICTAEASSNLARYDGVKYGYRTKDSEDLIDMYSKTRDEGFGEEVKRRIMLGTYVLSAGYYDAYYLKAQKIRTLILRDFQEAFKKCDLIMGPVMPDIAFKRGEKSDPLSMYLSDIYTISVNLAGLPGMSIPCGKKNGLPFGLQLIGKAFQEKAMLDTALSLEKIISDNGYF